jgi:hypothetical protein
MTQTDDDETQREEPASAPQSDSGSEEPSTPPKSSVEQLGDKASSFIQDKILSKIPIAGQVDKVINAGVGWIANLANAGAKKVMAKETTEYQGLQLKQKLALAYALKDVLDHFGPFKTAMMQKVYLSDPSKYFPDPENYIATQMPMLKNASDEKLYAAFEYIKSGGDIKALQYHGNWKYTPSSAACGTMENVTGWEHLSGSKRPRASASFDKLQKKFKGNVDEDLFVMELYNICVAYLHDIAIDRARTDLHLLMNGQQIPFADPAAVLPQGMKKPLVRGAIYSERVAKLRQLIMTFFTVMIEVGGWDGPKFNARLAGSVAGVLAGSQVKISQDGKNLYLSGLKPGYVQQEGYNLFEPNAPFPVDLKKALQKLVSHSTVEAKVMKKLALNVIASCISNPKQYMGIDIPANHRAVPPPNPRVAQPVQPAAIEGGSDSD